MEKMSSLWLNFTSKYFFSLMNTVVHGYVKGIYCNGSKNKKGCRESRKLIG